VPVLLHNWWSGLKRFLSSAGNCRHETLTTEAVRALNPHQSGHLVLNDEKLAKNPYLIGGCAGRDKPVKTEQWKKRVQMQRREKDLFFASHPQSPLSPEHRRAFPGLAYWPPDAEYHYELKMNEHDEKQIVELADTGGQTRSLWRWGEFRFQVASQQCTLQAYKSDRGEERLFLPFRDETSGQESYGAGRYLDLDPDTHLTRDGRWIVDFNEAYNPWCAYSENYVCPFVPPENWLQVPVRAGEKKYPLK